MTHEKSVIHRRFVLLACATSLGLTPAAFAQLTEPAEGADTPVIQAPVQPPAQPAEAPAAETDTVDPGLRAKLKQTIDAYAQLKSLSFKSKASYTGFLDGKSPATDAVVRMTRPADNPAAWLIHAKGTGKKKPTDPGVEFDVLWGPQSISWIDTPAKKLFERPAGQGRGATVQMAAGSVPTQITERIPFSRENVAESMTLDSSEPIGGVPCELLTVRPKGKHGSIKLWIGADDHLLRKVERVSESASYGSSSIIEISDLKVDETITPDSLTQILPEGFERDSVVIPVPRTAGGETASTVERPAGGPALPITPPGSSIVRSGGEVTLSPSGPTDSTGVQPIVGSEPAASATPEGPASTAATRQASEAQLQPVAPFAVVAADGTKVTPETLRGQTSVLFFYGSWSLASRAAVPELFKAREAAKAAGAADVKVFAFAVRDRSKEAAADFLGPASAHPATLIPRGDDAARVLGVRVFPTFVLVNAEGRVRARVEGFRKGSTPSELDRAIRELCGLPVAEPTPESAPAGASEPKSGPTSDASGGEAEGER